MGKYRDAGVEHKAIPFAVKAISDEGHGSFEGLGAIWNNVDAVGDIIAPGAFKDGLAEFLADGFIGGVDHDWKGVIGHPAAAHETGEGLYVKAVFDGSTEAQSTRARMTPHPETGRATIKKLSIGYRALESKRLADVDECKAYWTKAGYTPSDGDIARAAGPVRLLTRLKLFEVSPVLIPANDLARTTGVKSLESSDFASHSRKVASAAGEFLSEVEAFLNRFQSRLDARTKAGRELSAANWQALKDVHDRHTAMGAEHSAACDRMAAILERTKPGDRAKSADPAPPDHDAITQRFIATFGALAGLDR